MRSKHVLTSILTLCLSSIVNSCPLHATEPPHTYYDNTRRSALGEAVKTAIQDVRVFDGQKFTEPRTVCMDGGYIVDINGCSFPSTRVNASGKYLVPGFIDSHLHLTDVKSLENFTSFGCTTAFHMNCRNYTQCAMMAKQPGLASFVYAGMSAVGNGSAHEKTDPSRPKNTLIYPDTDVVQFTSNQFNNGSNFHKITAEVNGPSTQQQIDMVKTARYKYNKQAMTHASAVESYHQAVISNTDGIQHVPDDGLVSNSTIHSILAQNQFVTPTINVFEFAYRDPVLQKYFNLQPGSNRSLSHAEQNAKNLYQAGVPIAVGTDSVGTLTIGNETAYVPFGLTVHYEMQNMVEIVGMTPAEAINAATRVPAMWHRVPDRGSVEVQKRADLVLLGSDPLMDIRNTLDVERVWVKGVEVQMVTKRGMVDETNPATR